ncbi:glycosyltransferase [Acidaminococcus intestini]|uniref:glycosyltransferase n=1 Tax=Acidaminococcus intestini TaxID=187327 RepID=UPI003C6C35D5
MKNKGFTAARNYGVQQVKGNNVFFVDADNFLIVYFFDDFLRLQSDFGDDLDIYHGYLIFMI